MSPDVATKTLLSFLLGAISVAAHGHVDDIVVDGTFYQGYDVTSYPYMSDPPTVVGWATGATDNGFVAPDAYQDADIICHRDAENAGGFATVEAGSSIMFEWSTWPDSHHGPVIDYLANCGDDCSTVDKTTLEFFKISEAGLVDGTSPPGTWASDTLIDNGNRWVVAIPESIAPGNYVLRHEIIALHSAGDDNGAQNYPQCFNLQVTGSGSDSPSGVLGTELYQSDDAGILVNIYQTLTTYDIPGPTLYTGAAEASQTIMEITATSSATTDGATATNAATTSAAAEATTTSEAETSTSTAAASSSTTGAAVETTLSTSTSTSTSAAAEPTSSSTTASPLETITSSATLSSEPAATSVSEVFTKTNAPCGSKKHRRHARDIQA
ncbi:hypothetical protein MKZ38_005770 [Zalerion maritima]|uniref:lytic cellulose monooxygenase (C4-dehydrogenating) n=1 Tax=Zalerion maritima TaxID=339359 RepID=A0AAD5RK02_9PEZI|nr:hypothetical protein MKZ38_005770 [Zalerion maritima]